MLSKTLSSFYISFILIFPFFLCVVFYLFIVDGIIKKNEKEKLICLPRSILLLYFSMSLAAAASYGRL